MVTKVGNARRNTLNGTSSNDSLFGLGNNDILRGKTGDDKLYGGTGSDKLYGGAGKDKLYGGAGNDLLSGGNGNDSMYGGSGNDVFNGGAGADKYFGGSGTDTADYSGSNGGVSINLNGGVQAGGHAAGDTLSSIETVIGSVFGDVLTGNGLDNTLLGGASNDLYTGGGGNDVFQIKVGSTDTADFTRLAGNTDKIALNAAEFGFGPTLVEADLNSINNGNTDKDGPQLVYYEGQGILYYDADGNGAAFDKVPVLIISGNAFAQFGDTMTINDFILI